MLQELVNIPENLFHLMAIRVLFLTGLSISSIILTLLLLISPFAILLKGFYYVKKISKYFIGIFIFSISLVLASIQYKYMIYLNTDKELPLKMILMDKYEYISSFVGNEIILSLYIYLISMILVSSLIRYFINKN